ncbi:hypothetical protein [Actinomadura sp. 6N118]|uniref:hypothetical protein n=1 Tax=Actinomadura sp. 6N118 TaxID=3375151 RepID=UPI0037969F46
MPWSPPPQSDPWAPRETPHEPSAGETSISLSREPWDEPEIWQPPPSRKKKKALPLILIAAGVVLLAAVASAIVFWPDGSSDNAGPPQPQQSGNVQETQTGDDGTPSATTSATTSGPGLTEQAGKVDALLTEMVATRSELGTVTGDGECESSGLQRIRTQRQDQLEKARALEVSALESGTEMKDALVRALQASVESNQRYLDMAPDCPSTATDADSRASQAKSDFVRYWTPIAEQAGLQTRSADAI